MNKRCAEESAPGKRRNPFAPIDDNPLAADCWYIIYDMLASRLDRTTLKLLNKSACALFTRRCQHIRVVGVLPRDVKTAQKYCDRPQPDAPWLAVSNLLSLTVDGYHPVRILNSWMVRRAVRSIQRRMGAPIILKAYHMTLLGDDSLLQISGKLSQTFHTLHLEFSDMCYVTTNHQVDLSGVTIHTHNAWHCTKGYHQKPAAFAPLKVVVHPPNIDTTTESTRWLRHLFGETTVIEYVAQRD